VLQRLCGSLETEGPAAGIAFHSDLEAAPPEPTPHGSGKEAELVARIIRREPGAETELPGRYERGLRRVLWRCGLTAFEADEIVQEIWATALPKIRDGELRDPEKLNSFLCGIGRGLARNQRRKVDRRDTVNDPDGIAAALDSGDGPERFFARAQNARNVRRLLAQLNRPRDREVLVRLYLLGEEKDEICAQLGIQPNRFHSILSRAKHRFREVCASAPDAWDLDLDDGR
jgi:RNA polymerase sigma-70 factor, ECF subfamily